MTDLYSSLDVPEACKPSVGRRSVRATAFYILPEDVWMVELVHELHLLEHVGPVRAVLVHLEHHHLPGGLVGDLKESRRGDPLEEKIANLP